MLHDLLKEYLGDDSKVEEFLSKMKENKIYLSAEENIDGRYSKLKEDYESLSNKSKESENLIAQLKKQNGDNETLQNQIKEYEGKIAELEAEKEKLTIDNTLKFELLAKGAKANDIDYLIYRAKQGDTELKLDKEGKIKGLDDLIDGLKKSYASNFEESQKKKVDVKKLPDDDQQKDVITKEAFDKMGYSERNKLYKENKELYEQLSKGEE
jgi:hypothetical protein